MGCMCESPACLSECLPHNCPVGATCPPLLHDDDDDEAERAVVPQALKVLLTC